MAPINVSGPVEDPVSKPPDPLEGIEIPDIPIPGPETPPASGPSPEPAAERWTGKDCRALYAALGTIEALAATKLLRVPMDIAEQVFTFDDAELNQVDEPTAAVLEKYSPVWMTSYKSEIMLFLLLAAIHKVKFSRLTRMLQERAAGPVTQ